MQHHPQVYHLVHPQSYNAANLALPLSRQQILTAQPSPNLVDSPEPTLPNSRPDDKCMPKKIMKSTCINLKFEQTKAKTASLLKC